ncbi:hypothetical protein HT031_004141 [Scenedesmus sp. PABB004]|nr:hypothetical protein HT031_004141 [Scenedesmus sp. PABB004]
MAALAAQRAGRSAGGSRAVGNRRSRLRVPAPPRRRHERWRAAADGAAAPAPAPAPRGADAAALAATGRRYLALGLVKLAAGAALVVAPERVAAAALAAPPSALEAALARFIGVAVLFRALVALLLRDAAARGRLNGCTAPRLMLGCMLPALSHLAGFRAAFAHCGGSADPVSTALLLSYPAVHAAELLTHAAAFEMYHPHFILKLLFPVAVSAAMANLVKPLLPLDRLRELLPHRSVTPVTAGAAVLAGRHGLGRLAGAARAVVQAVVKALMRAQRGKRMDRLLAKLVPDSGPPLSTAALGVLDLRLPASPLAVAFWALALQHLATMLDAQRAGGLLVGTVRARRAPAAARAWRVARARPAIAPSTNDGRCCRRVQATPVSQVMRQSWSASFLAAAFAADALRSAADRGELGLRENRSLIACVGLLELGFAAALLAGMAQGVLAPTPAARVRVVAALAAATFCAGAWVLATRQAAAGAPDAPGGDAAEPRRAAPAAPGMGSAAGRASALALLALNVVASLA